MNTNRFWVQKGREKNEGEKEREGDTTSEAHKEESKY